MFSAFGAAAQPSSSAANNPFASKPAVNPFGAPSAPSAPKANGNAKRKGNSNDSDKEQKAPRAADDKKKTAPSSRHTNVYSKPSNKFLKPPASRGGRASSVEKGATDDERGASPSSVSSQGTTNDPSADMTDPHARNVYSCLHRDGISPPNWPSRPGDPANSAAMAKFRDKYETYRAQVRKSLTKAGLIDDPNKRRALKDAIEFKGIAQDMCPEYEKITRITELDVQGAEKDPEAGIPRTARMVKKLARSAAGQEAPLPMDVRSVATLRKTLDYLLDDLLQRDENLPTYHGFLWDRTRAIRRDFTFFSSLTPDEIKTQVYVLENIARFHVTALHLLSQKDVRPEDFVEQQELEQLGKSLLSLRDLYDDCNAQAIVCPNEAEFRAYYLIFHARDPNILEMLQRSWRPELWQQSDEIRTAVSLVEALQNTRDLHGPLKDGPSHAAAAAHHAYLRIVEDPSISYTMACFAECHFPLVRRSILRSVARALGRPKDEVKDVTAATLNRFLRFDTVQEAIDFAELHDLEFEDDPEDPTDVAKRRLVLHHRQSLPHVRLSHQFSRAMVEKKRGSHSLPDVIHRTVRQDPNSASSNEPSLFVPDVKPAAAPAFPAFGAQQSKPTGASPFSAPQPSGIFGGGLSNGAAAPTTQVKPNPFGAAQPASNPFASTSNDKPAPSPFGTAPQASTPALAFGAPSQEKTETKPAPFGSQPFGNPFGGTTDAKPTSQPQAPEAPKPNPFASAFQPKMENTAPAAPSALSGFTQPQQPMPAPTTTPAPTTGSILDKPKTTPSFSFPTTTSQPPEQKPLPTEEPAQNKPALPAQQAPSLPSFKPTPTTNAPPMFAAFGKPANEPTPAKEAPAFPPAAKSPGLPQFAPSQSAQAPSFPPAPAAAPALAASPMAPTPRRDVMGDFAKWYVGGDGGLMEDFTVYMVDEILKKTYDGFVEDMEEQARREEEERVNKEVETFRVYNLQVKFFYRWKRNARAKRLRELRRSGREQWRAYHMAKREEEKEAARQAEEERIRNAKVDRTKEMTAEMMRRKKEERAAAKAAASASSSAAVKRPGHTRQYSSTSTKMATSRPSSATLMPPPASTVASSARTRKLSGKSQAIRDALLNPKKPEGFRRSLGSMSMSSRSSASPEPRTSNVSERWRLKAMGIVQMPDGTALPENMANEILYGGKSYPGLSWSQNQGHGSRRRATSYTNVGAEAPTSDPSRSMQASTSTAVRRPTLLSHSFGLSRSEDDHDHEMGMSPPPLPAPTTNKRKRHGQGEEDGENGGSIEDGDSILDAGGASPPKRPMSESQRLIGELRAMREELEEGAAWYRSQAERLGSTANSRASTPWGESI